MPVRPGYPEGIVTRAHTAYVSTAARFGTAFQGPPEVQAFDIRTGSLTHRYVIPDADPSRDHGLSGIAFDRDGYLYVLDTQWGLVRIDLATRVVELYAPAFPDLKPCSIVVAAPCSPTQSDAPPLPNSIAFDAAGNAYVSDSLQATIWRIPAADSVQARAPQIWFQDERFDGPFGTNGIRFDAARAHLYIAVFVDREGDGVIYRLPVADPRAETLSVFHHYGPVGGPDELAFGTSGKVYVTLASSNQISVLRPDGTEEARFSGPADGDPDVPYDMPSGVTFHNPSKSLLVNNHSEVLGVPAHFVVFDVYVNDTGSPLELPRLSNEVEPLAG